jgi:DNA polymerase-3 subunit gamma/tau
MESRHVDVIEMDAASHNGVDDVRQMLGLADRARIIDLFEALMRGDMASALKELRDQYDSGADPVVVLTDLAEFTHFVTRVKIVPGVADDPSLAEVERTRGRAFAASLSMRVLARAWQMLFKGLADVRDAPKPLAAAEMVLVRIAYAADLPTPDELIRSLGQGDGPAPSVSGGGGGAGASSASAPSARFDTLRGAPRASLAPAQLMTAQVPDYVPPPRTPQPTAAAPTLAVASFSDLIALASEKRDIIVKTALERDVRLVRFEDGKLEIALEPDARQTLAQDLSRKLSEWTGRRWMVAVSKEQGSPSVKTQNEARQAALEQGVRADPLVQAVLARFPGAEIVGVRKREEIAEGPPPADADDPGAEPPDDMMDDDL